MPALQKAIALAKRVLCTNNNRQVVLASRAYAITNDQTLYSLKNSTGIDTIASYVPIWYFGAEFNLIETIKPYLGEDKIEAWLCPESKGLPIGVTYAPMMETPPRFEFIYNTTCYFPGIKYPQFDTLEEPTPTKLSKAKSDQPLVQDETSHYYHGADLYIYARQRRFTQTNCRQ